MPVYERIRRKSPTKSPSVATKAAPILDNTTATSEVSQDNEQILQLQRLVGNKAVHQLMRKGDVQREAHGKGCKCASCSTLQTMRIQRVDEHEQDIQAKRIQREGHDKGCSCPSCSGSTEDIQAMRIQRVDEHEEDIHAKRIQRDPEPDPTTVTPPTTTTTPESSTPTTTPESTTTTPAPEKEATPVSLVDTIKELIKTATDIVQTIQDHLKGAWAKTIADDAAMKEIATKVNVQQFLGAGMLVKAPLQQQLAVAVKYWTPITLANIRPSIDAATQDERDVVWKDNTLMADLKIKLGNDDYLNMQPVLRVFKDGVTSEDNKSHTRADKADLEIRKHLSAFVGDAVKAGRQVEGQVAVVDGTEWADAYAREFGNDGEEDTTNAFVERVRRTIWVHKTRGNAGTVIHEGVHKYAGSGGTFISDVGFNFNEGVTEYFTRKVTKALNYTRGNYEPNFLFAKKFAAVVGDDVLAKAYFDDALDNLITAYSKKVEANKSIFGSIETFFRGDDWAKTQAWTDLKTKVKAKDWAGATGLLP